MENEFENARMQSEEMFNNQDNYPPENVQQEDNGEVQQEQSENSNITNDAISAAQTAANMAEEKDNQLNQVLAELNAVREQNEALSETISQMSQTNEEKIVDEATKMPVLDVASLAFADDEAIQNAQSQYAQEMSDFIKSSIMKEMSPFIEQAKEGMYQKEKNKIISALANVPELHGIENMIPQLDNIIKNNKALSSDSVPIDDKYITAYAIARGVDSINTPPKEEKEPTPEELLAYYEKNPAFAELIEKKRLEHVQDSQQVPPFSASSGAVNAALNIKETPKTFEEASERTKHMFGRN